MAEGDVTKVENSLTPSEPLPIPVLTFPSTVQSENEKLFAAEDLAEQGKAEQNKATPGKELPSNELPPHDPLGAILEKNVMDSRDILATDMNKANDQEYYTEKFYLQQPSVQRIYSVLMAHGMDSQQAGKALKEIRDIVEG